MKKVVVVLVFLVSNILAQAQVDPKAQEILKSVSVKYKSFKTLSAKFKVNVTDQKTKTNESQVGTVILKGNKYKLLLGAQEIISDGNIVWTYLKDANEVQLNDPKSDPNAISPTNMFTIYEKGFKSKFIGEKVVGGKAVQIIELVPEDTKRNFSKVQLTVSKAEKYITQAIIYQKNGANISYAVQEFKPNIPADDIMFTFNKAKYPGCEEVDLRN
ncbi:MAG: outer membrane lipoprotein carrier protein LolA [Bacteroidia bacterium]|nr:outer membrane lipoprotein carrier protein LolA [Bacteroidia bacterium]HQV01191.1 outer membrane lipoprotein carrier protein LolA [Bacteroidia bacterium]